MPDDDPFADLGAVAVEEPAPAAATAPVAPVSFDDLGAQPAPAFDQAADYLRQAGDGLPVDIDPALPKEEQFQRFYANSRAFHEVNPALRLASSALDAVRHPLNTAGSVRDAAGNLASGAYEGIKKAAIEDANATLSNPLTASPKILASTALGAAKGIYGLGKLAVEGVGKVSDALDVGQSPEESADYRARRDFDLRSYNSVAEKPALDAVRSATPLPATAAVAENVIPALVPIGGEAAGLSVAGRAAGTVAEVAPKVAGGALSGAAKLTRKVA